MICKSNYIWKCIQNTIHWDKTQILKKMPSGKVNGTKNGPFFFCKLHLITVLILICDSYIGWSTSFVSLKMWVEFSIFDSISFLLKFIFLFNKMHEVFDFKTPFKTKIIEKPHTALLPDVWFLSCNKKF